MEQLVGLCVHACLSFMNVNKAVDFQLNEIPRTVSLVYKDNSRIAWNVKYTDKCTDMRPAKGEAVVGTADGMCVAFQMDKPLYIGFPKEFEHYYRGNRFFTVPKKIEWHQIQTAN